MAPSDTNLLDRWVQRKDAEAFGELVTRYADFVYGACLRVLRNDADAQDAAQNCFLRLARSPGEAPSNLPAWLHAVATRGSIDLVRRGARRRERERQFAEQSPPQAETSDSVEWREISMEIDRCISELPDELRYVIVARFLERKTHESIASDLNVSRQTVARRVDEGVQLLRKSLHRRGLSIGAATLGATLLHSMVEAAGPAPAALVANLGRMALSGVPSAASAFTLTGVVSGGIVVKKLFASAVAALVLCASVAWLVFRDDGPFVGDPSSSEGAELVRSEDPGVPVADRSAGRPNERRAEADPPAHGDDGTRRLRLRGQVIDQGGREVVGAQVVAQADQRVVVRGTSGDGGAFELAVPEGKEIVLAAYDEREGLSALLVSSSDSPGEEYELALQPLSTISGRIYDKETGQGVSRLPVSLVRRSNENESIETVEGIAAALFSGVVAGRRPQAVTDEEGHYIFRTPGPLVASLALKADVSGYIVPGYRTDQPLPVVEVEAAEILEGVDVSLSAGASISGVVVDPQGRGAGKVRVELVPSFPARYIRRVGTNNEGRFRFSGLPTQSSYRVRATKEGFAAVESETVSVPLATEIADIELQLVEGRQISGRFVDERGGPVARLSFTLEKVFESRLQGTGHRPILTDEDGYFEIDRVAAGEYVIRAWGQKIGFEHGKRFPFSVSPDEDVEDLEFELSRISEGFIAGRVVDETGAGVEVVVAIWRNGKRCGRGSSTDDGSFRIDGLKEEGDYIVAAFSGTHWGPRVKGIPLNTPNLAMTVYRKGRLTGRVVDRATREPVSRYEMRTAFVRTDGNRFHTRWKEIEDERGEFSLEAVEPDPVRIEVHLRSETHLDAKSKLVSVPPGGESTVEIEMDVGALLSGRVVDANTKEALVGARVRSFGQGSFDTKLLNLQADSWHGGEIWRLAMTDDDGQFQIGGMESGKKTHVIAWREGYAASVLRNRVVGEGAFDIELAKESQLRVELRGSRADESFGILALHRESPPWNMAFRAWLTKEGRMFRARGLPAGKFRLAIFRTKTVEGSKQTSLLGDYRAELTAGEESTIEIDVGSLANEFGSIAGRVDGPVELVTVDISRKDQPDERYSAGPLRVDARGEFQFTGLSAGEYVILARRGRGRRAKETRMNVKLTKGERAEGIALRFE